MQTKSLLAVSKATVAAVLLGVCASASALTISLDPRATYLRVNEYTSWGVPLAATAYSLSALGLAAGEEIFMRRVGDYQPSFAVQPGGIVPSDTSSSLLAVFSSSSTLLSAYTVQTPGGQMLTSAADRLPDALATTRAERVSNPTYTGSLPTDISEDFNVSTAGNFIRVLIPTGANFIFFSANDTIFGDNLDPDRDFGVEIERVGAVPLPGSLVLAGTGLLGLGALRLRRRS